MADAMDEAGFTDISEEQDGGLLKKILQEGTGDERPPVGSTVEVHYVGTLAADGSTFDSSRDRGREFITVVGVGQVIRGWDVGIPTMRKGEKAIFRASSDYAYGDEGSPPKIPGGATLDFEVELFKWKEKVKKPDEMSAEERSEYAMKQKEVGTEAFKAQDWNDAISAYAKGCRYITHGQGDSSSGVSGMCCDDVACPDNTPKAEMGDEDKKLAIALLTNCAMARLRLGDPALAKFDCSKALEFDPKNVKAFFRRAKAKFALGEHDAAMEDAAAVLDLEPDNKDADTLRKQAETEKRKSKQKEKAVYSKMFG